MLTPAQRHVRAVVDDVPGAGDEPEGQEGPGQQADDHRVHRDLAEHERPVVGEDLLHQVADRLGRAGAVVDPAGDAADALGRPRGRCLGGGVARRAGRRRDVRWCRCSSAATLPEARADRFLERSGGDEVALVVDGDLQLRQGPLGRAEDDLAVLRHVEGRLVARAEQVVRLLLVEPDRTTDVGADLGVRNDAVVAPVALLLGLDDVLVEPDEDARPPSPSPRGGSGCRPRR